MESEEGGCEEGRPGEDGRDVYRAGGCGGGGFGRFGGFYVSGKYTYGYGHGIN